MATAVLGTRLTLLGWTWAGIVALVIAFVLWAAVLRPVVAGWTSPTVGVSLLLAVSAESLAALAATVAAPEHARWLLIASLVLLGLGLGLYVFDISRFDFRQLAVGHGDHWITGGALGLATLAVVKIADAANEFGILGGRRVRQGRRDRALGPGDAVARGAGVRGGTVATAFGGAPALVDRVPARDVRRQ